MINLSSQFYLSDSNSVSNSLNQLFDFDNFLKSQAHYWFTNNLDCYWTGTNYFLYHNTSNNKFYFIPWDNNAILDSLSFQQSIHFQNIDTLINKIVQNTFLKNKYYDFICDFNKNIYDTITLFPHIDSIVSLIKNDVQSQPYICGAPYTQFINSIENTIFDSLTSRYRVGLKPYFRNINSQFNNQLSQNGYVCKNALNTTSFQDEDKNILFPNPTNGILHILNKSKQSKSKIEIYNALGILVFNTTTIDKQIEINLRYLSNGIYILKLSNNINSTFYKFTKQ